MLAAKIVRVCAVLVEDHFKLGEVGLEILSFFAKGGTLKFIYGTLN